MVVSKLTAASGNMCSGKKGQGPLVRLNVAAETIVLLQLNFYPATVRKFK